MRLRTFARPTFRMSQEEKLASLQRMVSGLRDQTEAHSRQIEQLAPDCVALLRLDGRAAALKEVEQLIQEMQTLGTHTPGE